MSDVVLREIASGGNNSLVGSNYLKQLCKKNRTIMSVLLPAVCVQTAVALYMYIAW